MFEHAILGTVQGIAEWLPVSSEAMIAIVKTNFFNASSLIDLVQLALFLHLGTFLAALIYFRKDVLRLIKTLFKYKEAEQEDKSILVFLIISTIITGVIAMFIRGILENTEGEFISTTFVNVLVGAMLLITGLLQIHSRKSGRAGLELRGEEDIKTKDSVFLGIAQGFAVIPGLSRSGLTVALLLLQRFKEESALRLSFLMSIPVVFGGNIILQYSGFEITGARVVGLIFAFIFGYITIDVLLKVARKINFGKFIIAFGILILIATFI